MRIFEGMPGRSWVFGAVLFVQALSQADSLWKPTSMRNDHFQAFVESDGILFGGSASGGIWTSRDKGRVWVLKTSCFGGDFHSVSALHASKGILAASFSGAGVCLSTDGGETWQELNHGLPAHPFIETFARVGDTLYAGGLGLVGSPAILKTSLSERKWLRADSGLPAGVKAVEALVVMPGGILVAGVSNTRSPSLGMVFVSRDTGNTWNPTPTPFPYLVYDLATVADMLILATEHGVFRSEDLGLNWRAPSGEPPRDEFYSLAVAGKKVYAGSGHAGIFESHDYGGSWSSIRYNLPVSDAAIEAVWGDSEVVLVGLGIAQGAWILEPAETRVRRYGLPGKGLPSGKKSDILGRMFSGSRWKSSAPR